MKATAESLDIAFVIDKVLTREWTVATAVAALRRIRAGELDLKAEGIR